MSNVAKKSPKSSTLKHTAPPSTTPSEAPAAPVSEARTKAPEALPVVSIPADEVRSLRISIDVALERGRELLWSLAEVLPEFAAHLDDHNAAEMRKDLLQSLADLSAMTQGLASVGISLAAEEALAKAKAGASQ